MTLGKTKAEAEFTLHLCGLFRVVDSQNKDCTPRGAKTCALLALLATSGAHLKSSRVHLQDKLWSDRGKEHGAASLRQCLSEIRRQFGKSRDALMSNRNTVGLDPARIEVVIDPKEGAFLEGIDIKDAEFEDWLAVERSRHAPRVKAVSLMSSTTEDRPPISVHFYRASAEASVLGHVEDFMLDSLGRTVRETLLANVTSHAAEVAPKKTDACDVRIKLRAFLIGENVIGLRVSAEDGRSGSLIWSDTQQTFLQGVLPKDSVDLLRIGNQLLDALSGHFSVRAKSSTERAASGMLMHLALQHLFSMTAEGSVHADQLLEQAAAHDPRNGLVDATRAHLRSIQWAERYGFEEEQLRFEAKTFMDRALDLEPSNSAVLATLANTSLILDRNFDLSEELANRAIALNPGNPFAWWVRSASELYLKDYSAAHKSARRASALLGPSPLKFWWDQQKGLTTAIAGSLDGAITSLRKTHAAAPTFRPALRALIALYAMSEDEEGIAEMARRLTALETDFSTERLADDTDYPSTLLRSKRFMSDRGKGLLRELSREGRRDLRGSGDL